MFAAIVSALLLSSSPASVPVDVGRFNPDQFPALELPKRKLPAASMVATVENILDQGQCRFKGQSKRRFDISVPYIVRLDPDGTLTRVVVADIGCAPLETYIGTMVREHARVGDFSPTGKSAAQWYSSEARFTLQ